MPGKARVYLLICALLAAAVFVVYFQTARFEFLSLDDGIYVFNNPRVKAGLSAEGLAWSFSLDSRAGTYWHPLTWLSHMLDVELFGLDSGAHHLVNVLFHLINTLLLFSVLVRLTGALWPSGLAAALFAVHPINVESVAWIAERKNVLSTCFWMLSLHLYIAYVKKPGMVQYGCMTVVFALGLLAKPMLVTLPFVLLLLDYWPLKRWSGLNPLASRMITLLSRTTGKTGCRTALRHSGPGAPAAGGWRPLVEKIPWILLSIAVMVTATASLNGTGAQGGMAPASPGLRVENALVSSITYLVKLALPSGLAMFYPYPASIPFWKTGVCALLLLALSFAALRAAGSRPYFIVGWLWFLGTLFPASGLVQAGLWPSWADRWAYIPAIGVFIAMAWGLNDGITGLAKRGRGAIQIAAGGGLAALAFAAHLQAGEWRDELALYRRAIEKVEGNFFACSNLGEAYYRRSELKMAAEFFAKAIEHEPRFVPGHIGMANTMAAAGNLDKAFRHYGIALELSPSEKTAYNNLGVLLLKVGRTEEARQSFESALQIDDGYAEAHNNAGFIHLRSGRLEEAGHHLHLALTLDPGNPMAEENLRELLELSRSAKRQ